MIITIPRDAYGSNMSLHPAGPKWTIYCGNCPGVFRARVPHENEPHLCCPYCGAFNKLRGLTWDD